AEPASVAAAVPATGDGVAAAAASEAEPVAAEEVCGAALVGAAGAVEAGVLVVSPTAVAASEARASAVGAGLVDGFGLALVLVAVGACLRRPGRSGPGESPCSSWARVTSWPSAAAN